MRLVLSAQLLAARKTGISEYDSAELPIVREMIGLAREYSWGRGKGKP